MAEEQTTQQQAQDSTGSATTAAPTFAEAERARIQRSEEMGVQHGAYNPAFMPGFRPDVYVPTPEQDTQAVGTQQVGQRTTAVADGDTLQGAKEADVLVHSDQFMNPTAGISGGTVAAINDTGVLATGGGTDAGAAGITGAGAGAGGTGAGTTGSTATGDAIETGQGSTDTSRAGTGRGSSRA
jgi:hypothetical protein